MRKTPGTKGDTMSAMGYRAPTSIPSLGSPKRGRRNTPRESVRSAPQRTLAGRRPKLAGQKESSAGDAVSDAMRARKPGKKAKFIQDHFGDMPIV